MKVSKILIIFETREIFHIFLKLIVIFKFTAGVLAAANAAMAPVPVIIGGNIVAKHSEPYILSLQRSGSHFCGGSLGTFVSKGVTAAHCYYSSGVTAVAGAHNIRQSESTTQKIQVGLKIRNEKLQNCEANLHRFASHKINLTLLQKFSQFFRYCVIVRFFAIFKFFAVLSFFAILIFFAIFRFFA